MTAPTERPDSPRPLADAAAVLHFWFDELGPKDWFAGGAALDDLVARRFTDLHRAAAACECWPWRATPRGRLAEVLVLDQFSRHLGRGRAQAFAHDAQALALAQEAVACGDDQRLATAVERQFLYLPYMHSESRAVHVEAERLYLANGQPEALHFERRHKAIVDRFGRYPHRNAALGRASTADEVEFLKQPGSAF